MQPMFTTNDSEFTRLEGLYIKEMNPPAQITGVFLGAVGVTGECVRGPVGKAVEITSPARFKEVFGGRDYGSGGTLIGKVWKALLNKPFGKLVVVRACAAAALAASFDWESAAGGSIGTAILRIAAANPGLWGNDVAFKIADATDGDVNHFNLTIRYLGNTTTFKNLDCSTAHDNLAATVGDDDGNLVVLTKLADGRPVNTAAGVDGADADGYVNLGETVSGFTSVAGTNGSIVDSDFTASGKGLDLLAGTKGLGVVFIAERSSATLKAAIMPLAAKAYDRIFLICADSDTTSLAAAKAEAASNRNDDGRIVYCFNHPYTLDPETASFIVTDPTSWMASILSQTDVDIHPGEEDTKKFLAGINRLSYASLQREDYIGLREAGISALEQDEGFAFVSGVVTGLVPGKTEITRRRMTDFLQLSAAAVLKYNVKKKNLASRRTATKALLTAFCNDLAANERVVDKLASGKAAVVVDIESLNTESQRAAGLEKIFWKVKLIGHQLFLVLVTEIGTGVTVEA